MYLEKERNIVRKKKRETLKHRGKEKESYTELNIVEEKKRGREGKRKEKTE